MDKKNDIIIAAQKLFGQFGLKKVTIDDIAGEASVAKATIYKYFPSKTEIFHEVVGFETDEMLKAIDEAVEKESTVSGKLRAHLMVKMAKIKELINFYRVTRGTWKDHWPHIEEITARFSCKEKKIVKSILTCGNQARELDVNDVDFTAHVMVLSLKSLEIPWAVEEHDYPLDNYVDRLLEIMLNGLRKR